MSTMLGSSIYEPLRLYKEKQPYPIECDISTSTQD